MQFDVAIMVVRAKVPPPFSQHFRSCFRPPSACRLGVLFCRSPAFRAVGGEGANNIKIFLAHLEHRDKS